MSVERIINSKLDNDTYKLTMGQAVLHNFKEVSAGFSFINRGKTQFPEGFGQELQRQIEMMADLKLTQGQRAFLQQKCTFLTPDFVDWFTDYRFNPDEVSIKQVGGDLSVDIYGPWHSAIYWEVPLMAIISELYFQMTQQEAQDGWTDRCRDKALALLLAGAMYADFGTRRRYSWDVHNKIVEIFKKYGGKGFLGTSNVQLAMMHDLAPIGTFAHEWVMGMAGVFGVEEANKKAMEIWAREFEGKLSTALTDTFTTDVFLRSFTPEIASIFKSLRQDSGSPEVWTEKVVIHLKELGLDPMKFNALYSDSLNTQKVLEIINFTQGKINPLFGIGTFFTNDVGVKPLNMVIKMFYITIPGVDQKIPVVKLSDDLGKISGDKSVVEEYANKLGLVLPKQTIATPVHSNERAVGQA